MMLADIPRDSWRPLILGWSDDILPFYGRIADALAPDATVVEVGVCAGRSIFYLAEQLLRLGKPDVKLFGVDWWTGPNFRQQLLYTYCANRFNGLTEAEIDMVKPITAEGARAAALFDDRSVDVVFIDSDHEKPGMLEHLHAWAPKVRRGGILAGHDYSESWPGVVEAVDEYFPGAGRVGHPTRTVWEVRMP